MCTVLAETSSFGFSKQEQTANYEEITLSSDVTKTSGNLL